MAPLVVPLVVDKETGVFLQRGVTLDLGNLNGGTETTAVDAWDSPQSLNNHS